MSHRPTKRTRKSQAIDSTLTATFDDLSSGEALPIPNSIPASTSTYTIDNVSIDRRRIHRDAFPLPDTPSSPTSHAEQTGTTVGDSGGPSTADWEGSFFVNEEAAGAGGRAEGSIEHSNTQFDKAKRYTSSVCIVGCPSRLWLLTDAATSNRHRTSR